MKYFLIGFINFYQLIISPLLGSRCRFYPSCSEYFCQSLIKHGIIKGVIKGLIRIAKCHPYNSGGYDPVEPDK